MALTTPNQVLAERATESFCPCSRTQRPVALSVSRLTASCSKLARGIIAKGVDPARCVHKGACQEL